LTFDDEVKRSQFLEPVSGVLTTCQPHLSSITKYSHGKLVELDEDFMPDSSIFEDGQSVRIHLDHLSCFGIRRHGGPVKVLFGVGMPVANCGGGGSDESGSGVCGTRGEVRS
jgi:hypothetical protein